nr:hypothetical protein [Pedobacter sp. ASV19]
MTTQENNIPREALRAVGTGLLLMSVFTMIWSSIANGGYQGQDRHLFLYFCIIIVLVFIVNSIKLFRLSSALPLSSSEQQNQEKKRSGKWFAIIFGLEGISIPIAINIAIYMHHPELSIPLMALVVGLHFYPLAWVFRRKIDYFLATWSCIIAISAIYFSLHQTFSQGNILAMVGTGLALATIAYGIYMIYKGRKMAIKALYQQSAI